jgi:hypothetical protein
VVAAVAAEVAAVCKFVTSRRNQKRCTKVTQEVEAYYKRCRSMAVLVSVQETSKKLGQKVTRTKVFAAIWKLSRG